MKRRDFVAAAAIAALYTPSIFAKQNYSTDNKYFTTLAAKKENINKCTNSNLSEFLNQESKHLLDLGYKQDSTFFSCTESSVLFFPYSLHVNDLGCLDKQYIVIKASSANIFEKITFLSQDFIDAVDLSYNKMLSELGEERLKKMLLPVSKSSSYQLFKSVEAEVNLQSIIRENERKYTLTFQTPTDKYSFLTFNQSSYQIA